MLTDIAQNANHFFTILTVSVSKTVKDVLFKHQSINVQNVMMATG